MLYWVFLLIRVILCSLEAKLNIVNVAFKCGSITVSCVTQSDMYLSSELDFIYLLYLYPPSSELLKNQNFKLGDKARRTTK